MVRMGQMLYLLDANVPIDANRDYYPIDRVPDFWDWLIALAQNGQVKIPQEIWQEVTVGNDAVAGWLRENAATMRLNEDAQPRLVAWTKYQGYARDLTDEEHEQIGQDPFLIAYALADSANRVVVSNENSAPAKIRANRRIPDVCRDLNIRAINIFALIRELDFRTR